MCNQTTMLPEYLGMISFVVSSLNLPGDHRWPAGASLKLRITSGVK